MKHDNIKIQDAFFDSWKRHNKIIAGVVNTLDEKTLKAKVTETSPDIAYQLAETHSTRKEFLGYTAPEFAKSVPWLFSEKDGEYIAERDKKKILSAFKKSEKAVADAVLSRSIRKRQGKVMGMDNMYSHPVHFLQHMLWHEAYHIGQIMLALKVFGAPMSEEVQQKIVWKIWKS